MTGYTRLAKDEASFIKLLAQISADALVITRPTRHGREPEQGPHALTDGLIGAGNWLLLGQCSFHINGASDTEMEMRLQLAVTGDTAPLYTRHAYLRLHGLNFGTATVIGACNIPKVASVELTYMTEFFGGDVSAQAEDAIIVAVKVSDLVAVA